MESQSANIVFMVQSNSDAEELDFATFLSIFGQGEENSESSLQQLYEAFDPNGTNSFGPEDFERVCDSVGERFTPAEVDQMIDYADKDRDGGISYEEFCAIVTREYPKIWSPSIEYHLSILFQFILNLFSAKRIKNSGKKMVIYRWENNKIWSGIRWVKSSKYI